MGRSRVCSIEWRRLEDLLGDGGHGRAVEDVILARIVLAWLVGDG